MSASPATPCIPPASSPPSWLIPFVLATATLAFFSTLGGSFLGDDFVYIARFRELPWSARPVLVTRDLSGGIRGHQLQELSPFAALSFMGDAKLFGGWAPDFRLTDLALHLAATAIVARQAWRYIAARLAATGQSNESRVANVKSLV
jgi:hypothetical protein